MTRQRRIDDVAHLIGRTGDIWQAAIRGETQEAIAKRHRISQQRVSQIIKDVQAQVEPETAEAFNQRTLDLMAALTAGHTRIIDAGPTPKTSAAGKVVTDPTTGQPVPDWSQVMQAAANVVRFTERAAKILGSDAAAKIDATVHVAPEDIELVQRIRDWKAARDATEAAEAPE